MGNQAKRLANVYWERWRRFAARVGEDLCYKSCVGMGIVWAQLWVRMGDLKFPDASTAGKRQGAYGHPRVS